MLFRSFLRQVEPDCLCPSETGVTMGPNMDRDKFQNDAEHGDPMERMDRLQAEVARISRLLDEFTGNGTSATRPCYSRDAGADELQIGSASWRERGCQYV